MKEKTHYRKVFNSPYLSSADIVEPTTLKIARVVQEPDKARPGAKNPDFFNTAYFTDKEIRPGEPLKPMILNATNSRTMSKLTGSKWIEDWAGTDVIVYVDQNVRFGRDTVEGLRISTERPKLTKEELLPENTEKWQRAVARYKVDESFDAIEKFMTISDANKKLIKMDAEGGE